jgi:ribosomal protein L13E
MKEASMKIRGRRTRLKALGATALAMLVTATAAAPAGAAPPKKVTISGKAYRFNHMDTFLPGATIRVREFPKIRAVTGPDGDYVLKVPNDRNVTPYIESGSIPPGTDPASQHYNEIDLQTFHPRGRDIVNANFQVPTDFEYNALKGILSVPSREDGRPEQCAIVTTSSDRDVRGVDYQTFWDRTKTDANGVHGHGVPGATSRTVPPLGPPTYFNDFVIPDRTETSTSSDGGIIWEIVPAGTYRIITSHPDTRFASFLATCRDGRIVNANPPWGAYQLAKGEKPLAASNVAARVESMSVGVGPVPATRKNRNLLGKRSAYAYVKSAERIDVRLRVFTRGRKIVDRTFENVRARERAFHGSINRKVRPGRGRLRVDLTDASGVTFSKSRKVRLARVLRRR